MDPVALYQFFSVLHIPAPRSGVLGVSKMLPAHSLTVKDGKVSLRRFWKLSPKDEFAGPGRDEAREIIFSELERAVGDELVSDVPLGVFLSGGVDSSTVTSAALKQSSGKIKAYTVGFEEKQWDESQWASAVAKELNAEQVQLENRAQDLPALIEKIIWHFDEPNGNYTAVANYLLCQACRKEITVALSGAGGDEVFAGYTHHLADKLINGYYSFTPALLRKHLLAPIFAALALEQDQSPGFRRKLSRGLGFEEPDLALRHLRFLTTGNFKAWMDKGEFLGLDKFSAQAREENDPYLHLARWAYEYPGKDGLNSLLWLDINTYLCDDILLMTDRMSMANALEVRVPLLDHKLVELLFSVPFSYKLPGLDKKFMLKSYLLKKLPRELVYRPKQGFGIPLQVWIKDRLKNFFQDLFECELARNENFISMPVARQLLKEHEQGRDHTHRIWMVAHYLLWKKTFGIS
jgi:asparagine synthase (glutamine-hydrolysing)